MREVSRFRQVNVLWLIFGIFSLGHLASAQRFQEPGKSIGTISTHGNLIVMTLDEGVLGKANLFDLAHHTLRLRRMDPGIVSKICLCSGTRTLVRR